MAEEVVVEVEAVQSVYEDDCHVIEPYPPHLHVHLKPRTADVSSQQFVEAIIGIRAGPQYPEEPPDISVIDSKGLDERRQKHLITSIRAKAIELASCLMLVALCEEAVERLSSMNHPDGDCPLCLYPLLDEDDRSNSRPFMKLMSCFHCFHCDCIIRWWNWNQMQSEEETTSSLNAPTSKISRDRKGMRKIMEESMGKCPVCRKVFLTKDIEHVLDLVGTDIHLESSEIENDKDILESDSEKNRRQKFDAILKLQQENSGLIESKKSEVLLPGMFLPQPVALPSTDTDVRSNDSLSKDPVAKYQTRPGPSVNGRGSRKQRNTNSKKHCPQDSTKQVRHWIRKENDSQN
ncbi:hypothetical protein ACJIZ3_016271 [Penstemon smallii]|uniref:E3 ubiquitin-protein ligase RNF25 n=1 Tax=Penstemon smallii TaxID=265156 RepID=A0ABD3RQ39_9LAMI